MRKLFTLTLLAIIFSISGYAIAPIEGTTHACVGGRSYLIDSTPGGIWYSSNIAIATVDSMGFVLGISAGTCTITYDVSGTIATTVFTVHAMPSPITGPSSVCVGSTIALSCATPGGVWSSSDSLIALAGRFTGAVTGVSGGTADIYYTVDSGCYVSTTITVGGTTLDSISGPATVCLGTTATLTNSTPGGTWSSANPAIATVGVSTGIVTGVSLGAVMIDYTASTGCGTGSVGHLITVVNTSTAGTISGATSVSVGGTATLSSTVVGGAWSSSNPGVATINPTTGMVTGIAAGTATITYSVTTCSGGTVYSTATITVLAFDGISGYIHFDGARDSGIVRVWLINYNTTTHMLTAVDSTTVSFYDTTAFYSFSGVATDSFRIKAAVICSLCSGVGYIPTYHDSAYYWHDAHVLYHTSGLADYNQDIYMGYGTTTTGPGFIAGDVTTGANKGTSGPAPVVGLPVYIFNTATGRLMQQTKTDAAGHYTFSNLPVGAAYRIFPEALNYQTVPYSSINLTSGAPVMSAAHFTQHTISMTITPNEQSVQNIGGTIASVVAYPNPTTGIVTIKWQDMAAEKGSVVITDITGRVVSASDINMTDGSGARAIDLSSVSNGLYIISVHTPSVNYIAKLQVQH